MSSLFQDFQSPPLSQARPLSQASCLFQALDQCRPVVTLSRLRRGPMAARSSPQFKQTWLPTYPSLQQLSHRRNGGGGGSGDAGAGGGGGDGGFGGGCWRYAGGGTEEAAACNRKLILKSSWPLDVGVAGNAESESAAAGTLDVGVAGTLDGGVGSSSRAGPSMSESLAPRCRSRWHLDAASTSDSERPMSESEAPAGSSCHQPGLCGSSRCNWPSRPAACRSEHRAPKPSTRCISSCPRAPEPSTSRRGPSTSSSLQSPSS